MLKKILLITTIIILAISYIRIILIYFQTKNKKIKNLTGFDLAKEITSNYNEINIVESKEINISKYNLKRRVIRLTNKNYEANDLFTLAITACLSGYSLANINKDKYLQFLTNIFPNIDYLDKTPILSLIIALLANNISDAKIAIFLLIILLIYQYIMIQIAHSSNHYTIEELKKAVSKKNATEIEEVLTCFLSLRTISFITTLILILSNILTILNY